MKYSNNSDTLFLHGLVVVAIIVIGFMVFSNGCGGEQHAAEMGELVSATAENLGFQNVSAVCDPRDTDGDGKISCTVSHTVHGERQAQAWTCPSRFSWSSTCQMRSFF